MQLKDGFVLRQVCGENIIVGEGLGRIDFGRIINPNETAAFLWQKAAERKDFTAEELVDDLCEAYEVSREQATADVEETLAKWKEIGLM